MVKKILLYGMFILLLSFSVFGFEFSVEDITEPVNKPYNGETATLTAALVSESDNICFISCTWSSGQYEGIISNDISPDQRKIFGFNVGALGTEGGVSSKLIVTCNFVPSLSCLYSPKVVHEYPVLLSFNYDGDNICTVDKESCATAEGDCICFGLKECNPDSPREIDERGCATYCGNGEIEPEFENCGNCPKDAGKCSGESCTTQDECEDEFCIRNRCSKYPYLNGDGYCDSNLGENCKNSLPDCACNSLERCSGAGLCETYCGNGVCEPDEVEKCKPDCDWCGDLECNSNENCRKCSTDCGVCEIIPIDEIRDVNELVKEQQEKMIFVNKVIIIALGISLLIFVVIWKIKHKRVKCPKCHNKIKKSNFCPECGKKLK